MEQRQDMECAGMTKREKDVLHLLLQGKSNKQIASSLDISEYTARDHVSSILRRKGVSRRVELFAAEMGKSHE